MTIDPQPQTASVSPAILALNNAHSIELSWLDAERLDSLVEQSCYARKIGSADAFLLAFDHTAQYDSPNYLWFSQRFPRFVYIDRVAVAPTLRGRGYARLLYSDLFDKARSAAHNLVVCEVNSDPPNPASEAFHARMAFDEVGRASILQGSKTVRYLACHMRTGEYTQERAI
jgi:predicted GNAT superfamily acetyltransferase